MKTRIVKRADGVYELQHASTGQVLGTGDSRETCQALANTLRQVVKVEAAQAKIAELSAPGDGDDLAEWTLEDDPSAEFAAAGETVELGCGPMLDSLRLFTDEVENLGANPLLDSHGNEIPRTFREGFVLRPGTFVSMSGKRVPITRSDILEFARNHDPLYPPKIQIQHNDHPRETLGYVAEVKVHGRGESDTRMHQLLEFRGKRAVEDVEAGLYRDLSVGLYRQPGNQRIRETSIVGEGAVGGTGGERARILPITPPTAPGTHLAAPALAPPVETSVENVDKVETTVETTKGGSSLMGFFSNLFGLSVKSARADKKAKGEAINLSGGVTEADLDKIEAGDESALTKEKALAVAESLGLDKEGVAKFLIAMEADGAFKPKPAPAPTPVATLGLGQLGAPGIMNADGSINLAAFPVEMQPMAALIGAQQAQISALTTQLSATTQAAQDDANTRAVNDLILMGKVTPANKDTMVTTLGKMDDGTRADFLRMMGMSEAEVKFGRMSLPDVQKPDNFAAQTPEQKTAAALDMLASGGWGIENGKLVDPTRKQIEAQVRGVVNV